MVFYEQTDVNKKAWAEHSPKHRKSMHFTPRPGFASVRGMVFTVCSDRPIGRNGVAVGVGLK